MYECISGMELTLVMTQKQSLTSFVACTVKLYVDHWLKQVYMFIKSATRVKGGVHTLKCLLASLKLLHWQVQENSFASNSEFVWNTLTARNTKL